MPDEHVIEYIELGAWQSYIPIVQARCEWGWETERKPAIREAVETAAQQHLATTSDVAG